MDICVAEYIECDIFVEYGKNDRQNISRRDGVSVVSGRFSRIASAYIVRVRINRGIAEVSRITEFQTENRCDFLNHYVVLHSIRCPGFDS